MRAPVEIGPGLWRLGSDLVNWYLVEEAGRLTAVDAGLPGFGRRLDADLAAIGFVAGDVEAVVLTHADPDHTGVAPRLQKAGARVLVHAGDARLLRRPGAKGGEASAVDLAANAWRPLARSVLAETVRTGGLLPARVSGPVEHFADGAVLDVPGRPRALHTPGHTHGHCVLHFERHGALVVGDALISHRLVTGGRGPSLMPRHMNVDTARALSALGALEDVDAGVMLFGHGDPWHDGTAAALASAREQAAA